MTAPDKKGIEDNSDKPIIIADLYMTELDVWGQYEEG